MYKMNTLLKQSFSSTKTAIIWRDLSQQIFYYKPFVIVMLSQLIDIFLFLAMYARLIGKDYFIFSTLGFLCFSLYVNSFRIGSDYYRDQLLGFQKYLDSLPLSHIELVFSRLLAGVIAGNIYNFLLLLPLLYFANIELSFVQLVCIFILSLVFSVFSSSLSLTIVESITNPRSYRPIVSLLTTYMSFFSTVFYPANSFPIRVIIPLVNMNPLSTAAEAMRSVLISEIILEFENSLFIIVCWAILLIFIMYFIQTIKKKD